MDDRSIFVDIYITKKTEFSFVKLASMLMQELHQKEMKWFLCSFNKVYTCFAKPLLFSIYFMSDVLHSINKSLLKKTYITQLVLGLEKETRPINLLIHKLVFVFYNSLVKCFLFENCWEECIFQDIRARINKIYCLKKS